MLALASPCFVGREQHRTLCRRRKKHIFRKLPCTYNTILTGQIVHWQCRWKFFWSPLDCFSCKIDVLWVVLFFKKNTKLGRRICDFILRFWVCFRFNIIGGNGCVTARRMRSGAVQFSLWVHLLNMFCVKCNWTVQFVWYLTGSSCYGL